MTFPAAALAKFNAELQKFGRVVIPAKLVERQKKVALQVLTGVVLKTPVLTGRARGGWSVSINKADEIIRKRKDKAGQLTISQGTSVIESVKPFSAIFINNNVEYIIPLENGHSAQRPNGMIAITLEEVLQNQSFDT